VRVRVGIDLLCSSYGAAKLSAEHVIRTYAKSNPRFRATILRYFNVYGCDPAGRLCEFPRPELGKHGRISTACFDAALGRRPSLAIFGTDFPTSDGSAVRDYIHVSDLVSAHLAALKHQTQDGAREPPIVSLIRLSVQSPTASHT